MYVIHSILKSQFPNCFIYISLYKFLSVSQKFGSIPDLCILTHLIILEIYCNTIVSSMDLAKLFMNRLKIAQVTV